MRMTSGLAVLAVSTALGTALAGAQESFYATAAQPYAGTTIRVLDEITPLQEKLSEIVPDFEAETGIAVEWELLNHGEVINRGQADMLSGRGYYDAVMLHGFQLGPMIEAKAIRPVNDLVADPALTNPDLDTEDFIQTPYASLAFDKDDNQYGFINWNYNQVYWARADLFENAEEKAAFEERYGYPLAPAETVEQMRDIAEFFTRKSGETLAGEPLASDFYGIVLEGIRGGTTFGALWYNLIKNYGGDIVDAEGRPNFDTPETVAALTMWAELWTFAPPGIAEYSLVDVPTVMGNGIAAQSIAWSDFVLGIDRPGASPLAGQFLYAPVPTVDGRSERYAEGEPSLTVISAASENAEATFLFLQWLADKRQQDRLIELGEGGVPIRESSWALPVLEESANKTLYSAMRSTLDVSTAKPKMPRYFEIYDVMGGIAQEVGLGRITPEEGAAQGQEALMQICDACLL